MMQMIRILKIDESTIIENFPAKELIEVGQDQDGNPIYEERWNIPQTEQELRKAIEETMVYLERRRIKGILNKYGYNSLGDAQLYASRNDSEAQAILNFYTNNNGNGYDDLIWDYIDNLINKTYDELLQDVYDLYAVEEQIYQTAIQNNPLP